MNGHANQRATRRAFLAAASAVAVAAGLPPAATATSSPGPIAKLATERRALLKAINDHEGTEAEAEAMLDRWSEIDRLLIESRADTPEDAVALLQVARDDYYQFNIETKDDLDQADQGERLVLSAFDNALRIFRTAAAPIVEASA